MKKMPEFLHKTIVQIALEQKTIKGHEGWLAKKFMPAFRFKDTDKKYGETEEERILFWSKVLIDHKYELFMEKFPETQEIIIGEQKFML